jgi:hypothetical protein
MKKTATLCHKLTEGDVICFQRGGDTEPQIATVRSVEVSGNYVTVWVRRDGELDMFLTDKTTRVEVL